MSFKEPSLIEKLVTGSAWILFLGFLRWLLKGRKMEQAIGSYGKLDETYSKGVASASGSFSAPANEFGLSLSLQLKADLDAKTLVAYLAAKVGGPIPAEVAAFIESALAIT